MPLPVSAPASSRQVRPRTDKGWLWASTLRPVAPLPWPRTLARRTIAPHHSHQLPAIKFLALVAACLGVVFVSSIACEAFDSDLDLWPFGVEDFSGAAHAQCPTGSQLIGGVWALHAILSMLVTAGACLVLHHRARSALAADAPAISVRRSGMAEPWGPITDWYPGARPFVLR